MIIYYSTTAFDEAPGLHLVCFSTGKSLYLYFSSGHSNMKGWALVQKKIVLDKTFKVHLEVKLYLLSTNLINIIHPLISLPV